MFVVVPSPNLRSFTDPFPVAALDPAPYPSVKEVSSARISTLSRKPGEITRAFRGRLKEGAPGMSLHSRGAQ